MPPVEATFSREELEMLRESLQVLLQESSGLERLWDIDQLRCRVQKMLAYTQEPA